MHPSRASTRLKRLVHVDFGDQLVPYDWALNFQQTVRTLHRSHDVPDVLLQLQHPAVYTVGKRGQPKDFLVPEEILLKRGINIHRVLRGGETTYHGPGQLILYPIVDLRRLRKGARAYVEGLEDTVVNTLAMYGVSAQGRQPSGRTGVWIGDRKIAALGVQISAGIATHGTALNVTTDLQRFKDIVPCGLPESPVTSLKEETKRNFALHEVSRHLQTSYVEVFAYNDIKSAESRKLLKCQDEQDLLHVLQKAQAEDL